jgi:hypothetical protein
MTEEEAKNRLQIKPEALASFLVGLERLGWIKINREKIKIP